MRCPREDGKDMSREGENLCFNMEIPSDLITQLHKGLRLFPSRSTYLCDLVQQLIVLLSLLQRAQVTAHLAVAGPPTDLWQ